MFTSFQEVFRSTINLFGDLCARVVRWRSQTVELSVLSLLLWVLVLLVAAVSLSYLNTSVLEVSRDLLSEQSSDCFIGVRQVSTLCMPFILGSFKGGVFEERTDAPEGAQVRPSCMLPVPQRSHDFGI